MAPIFVFATSMLCVGCSPAEIGIDLNNRRTMFKNCRKQCFRLSFVASRATNGNRKTLFQTIFLSTFVDSINGLIAAYIWCDVFFRCKSGHLYATASEWVPLPLWFNALANECPMFIHPTPGLHPKLSRDWLPHENYTGESRHRWNRCKITKYLSVKLWIYFSHQFAQTRTVRLLRRFFWVRTTDILY